MLVKLEHKYDIACNHHTYHLIVRKPNLPTHFFSAIITSEFLNNPASPSVEHILCKSFLKQGVGADMYALNDFIKSALEKNITNWQIVPETGNHVHFAVGDSLSFGPFSIAKETDAPSYHDFSYAVTNLTPSLPTSDYLSQIEGLDKKVKNPETGALESIKNIIIKLNDIDKWTREQIADWLETLDEVPIFKRKEETNVHEN